MTADEKFMQAALQQAREALAAGDFPVGCVIEYDGGIVASGRRRNSFGQVNEMDHAEIAALRELLVGQYSTAYRPGYRLFDNGTLFDVFFHFIGERGEEIGLRV